MDDHLKTIFIKEEYKAPLESINKEHYLNDLADELDELL